MWKHGVIPNNWLIIGYFSCLPKSKSKELPAADVGKGQSVGLTRIFQECFSAKLQKNK
jgi:hypothetical protein